MYCAGWIRCKMQGYYNTTFSASEITENIYVGDLASASNKKAMKEQGITHILTVLNGAYEIFPDDFSYKVIHINDDPWVDIGKYFDESNKFIDEALQNRNNKIMIHCQRGASRSVTLLLAYKIYKLNQKEKIKYEEIDNTINSVLDSVKNQRSIAEPNKGFIDSLKTYICKLNNYDLDINDSHNQNVKCAEIKEEKDKS